MNESEFNHLREESWRRRLTALEEAQAQAYLATRPEAQAEWEWEASLNQALGQLPDAPLSSHFTARVMQAVERETLAQPPLVSWLERLRQWGQGLTVRAAWVGAVAALMLLALYQVRVHQTEQLAHGLAALGQALPEPKVLEDFEIIEKMGQLQPVVDEVLWMALNQ